MGKRRAAGFCPSRIDRPDRYVILDHDRHGLSGLDRRRDPDVAAPKGVLKVGNIVGRRWNCGWPRCKKRNAGLHQAPASHHEEKIAFGSAVAARNQIRSGGQLQGSIKSRMKAGSGTGRLSVDRLVQNHSPGVYLMMTSTESDNNRPRPPKIATVKDRKSTRLNSSHTVISYAVFCLKKK